MIGMIRRNVRSAHVGIPACRINAGMEGTGVLSLLVTFLQIFAFTEEKCWPAVIRSFYTKQL